MKRPPATPAQIAFAETEAENNRQRWLVRTGRRAYPGASSSSARRVGSGGVHAAAPRSSDLPALSEKGGRQKRAKQGRSSSSLAADILTLALFALAFGWALIGLIWTAYEVLQWVGNLLGGGAS